MARSKPKVVQHKVVPGANQPAQQVEQLNIQIRKLSAALAQYAADEVERNRIRAEYNRVSQTIDAMADATVHTVTENVTIEWLDKYHDECRRARVTIPDAWDRPMIFAKGDEQLGHVTCDEVRVAKDIAWVEKNPQCLTFLLGDCIDSATKTSPGSIRDNNRTPLRQIESYVELHKGLVGRIIGLVGGNHERRIDKALDDPGSAVRLLAKGLSSDTSKVPYSSGILLVDVCWRGHVWTFTLFHGAGAAVTPGSKIQRMQRNNTGDRRIPRDHGRRDTRFQLDHVLAGYDCFARFSRKLNASAYNCRECKKN